MKPAILFISTLLGCASAIDLYLFDGRDCTGSYQVCKNAKAGSCCHGSKTYLSSGALNGTSAGVKVRSFVAAGDLACTGPYTADSALGTCIADQKLDTRAISWHMASSKRFPEGDADCPVTAPGDELYSDGTTAYVISQERMHAQGLELPTREDDKLEFFKTHAEHTKAAPRFVNTASSD